MKYSLVLLLTLTIFFGCRKADIEEVIGKCNLLTVYTSHTDPIIPDMEGAYVYDINGFLVSTVDGRTSYTYDAAGRIIEVARIQGSAGSVPNNVTRYYYKSDKIDSAYQYVQGVGTWVDGYYCTKYFYNSDGLIERMERYLCGANDTLSVPEYVQEYEYDNRVISLIKTKSYSEDGAAYKYAIAECEVDESGCNPYKISTYGRYIPTFQEYLYTKETFYTSNENWDFLELQSIFESEYLFETGNCLPSQKTVYQVDGASRSIWSIESYTYECL